MTTNSSELKRTIARMNELVRLPEAPKTRSPVPWLTSIHAREGRGDYGDATYRGNCSGLLIADLLNFFQPATVFDPMAGGGTCKDVCRHLRIPCQSHDLRQGCDASDLSHFRDITPVDFVWLHPPYFKMIAYNQDHRCLSASATLSRFLLQLKQVLSNCLTVLKPNGVIALLIGDGKHERLYMGLPYRTLQAAEELGLWLAAPEIVRFSHGSSSSTKVYSTSFIPRLHDICFLLKRRTALLN